MKSEINTLRFKIVRLLADFIPAAKREVNRMVARDAFNMASGGVFTRIAPDLANIARQRLTDAGYDIDADLPYREVFGLKGGKAEFDAKITRSPDGVADAPVRMVLK